MADVPTPWTEPPAIGVAIGAGRNGWLPSAECQAAWLFVAENLGLLSLILRFGDGPGFFGVLQVNQLLPDGGRLGLARRAASKLEIQTSSKQRQDRNGHHCRNE